MYTLEIKITIKSNIKYEINLHKKIHHINVYYEKVPKTISVAWLFRGCIINLAQLNKDRLVMAAL